MTMPTANEAPRTRRAAPVRRIVARERSGSYVTDRLACGHSVTARYSGFQRSRKCALCALEEANA